MKWQPAGGTCFFFLGIIVNFVFIYSIFDVYYTSPLVHNARPHDFLASDSVAKRLVVFSADGLRARSFFEYPEKSPFLSGLMNNVKCVWGISTSHVPTESRPGHVAMMAGIYEDVSAVTKGWSQNPVAYDSIFNQSRSAYLFGSPDIIPMFGDHLKQAKMYYYSHDEEDFSRNDASFLDKWVFDKVTELLNNYTEDINNDKTVFFLHLLGLDTNGHGHKPNSDKYIDNIRFVDEGIKNMVDLFNQKFSDKKTAFLFTADHGMTDWGSHGSGTEDEVLTPFVLWGHGVKPLPAKEQINQVDLTPLQAALLGVPIPVNSLGIVPLNFLDLPPKLKSNVACTNLKQMVEQFALKRAEKERNSFSFLFKEYPQFKVFVLNKVHEGVSSLMKGKRYDAAAQLCLDWVPLVRSGLYYFHRYNRTSLGIAISTLFISWIMALYTFLRWSSFRDRDTFKPNLIFKVIIGLEIFLAFIHKWSFNHLIFFLLPTYVISLVVNGHGLTWNQLLGYCNNIRLNLSFILITVFVSALLIFIFVLSFFERSLVSFILLISALFPYLNSNQRQWCHVWAAVCVLLAIFPLLPPVGSIPQPLIVTLCPLLATAALLYYSNNYCNSTFKSKFSTIAGATFISFFCNAYFLVTGSPSRLTNILSWLCLLFGFTFPFTVRTSLTERYIAWMSCTYLVFSLMSMAHESLFILLFMVLLFIYVRLEHSHVSTHDFFNLPFVQSKIRSQDTILNSKVISTGVVDRSEWQRAVILVTLIEVAFFGTGNLASLNGFNPSTIKHFVTTFSPFLMMTLIILKIAIPFLQVSFALSVVLHQKPHLLPRLALLLMIITDVMAMIFFFCLKDDGSWLDIGMSISHYGICLGMSTVVFLLIHIAKFIIEY